MALALSSRFPGNADIAREDQGGGGELGKEGVGVCMLGQWRVKFGVVFARKYSADRWQEAAGGKERD